MKNEHAPPAFYSWLLKKLSNHYNKGPALGDLEEMFAAISAESGRQDAVRWYRRQVVRSIPALISISINLSLALLLNNFKAAFRNMTKQKGCTVLNITGLAVGIACCLLITRFVLFERSYDNYHKDLDRIFHVRMKVDFAESGRVIDSWSSSYRVVDVLMEDYPEVVRGARYNSMEDGIVEYGDKRFVETNLKYADQDFLHIISGAFIRGVRQGALTRPGTIVLTRSFAEKFFGTKNPVGSSLTYNDENYEVTGVVEDPPANSYFQFDAIIDYKSQVSKMNWLNPVNDWLWFQFDSYIKLQENVDPVEFGSKIRHLAHNYVDDYIREEGYANHTLTLQPVSELYLNSRRNYREYLTMFLIIGGAIVLIACVNFINLVTARAANRGKDIGIRKVAGAQRNQLVIQFMVEAFIQTGTAFLIAIGLCVLTLPLFNTLAGSQFTISGFLAREIVLFGAILLCVTSMVAGSYPALVMSSFKPVEVLSGKYKTGAKRSNLRRGLVLFQFIISILLIISTWTVNRQLQYMKNANLGFTKNRKLVVPVTEGEKYETYIQEFSNIAGVTGVTASLSVPGRIDWINSTRLKNQSEGEKVVFNYHFCDENFIPSYKIKMAAGQSFSKNLLAGLAGQCIINVEGVKILGLKSPEEAIGKILYGWNGEYEIIGVTENFHFQGLQKTIKPIAMLHYPRFFEHISMTVNTGNLKETLESVEKKWQSLFPENVYRFRFLDDDFMRLYNSEERLGRIFGAFSVLAVLISCLGLVGLSAYMAEQRKKEIGIRKVLGASVTRVVCLLLKEFTIIVVVANVIALPLGWYHFGKWLQGFAYRTETGMATMLLVGMVSLLIALLTVSSQAFRAARANPAETIRCDL